jgi:hypothetical protein
MIATNSPLDALRVVFFRTECTDNSKIGDFATLGNLVGINEEDSVGALIAMTLCETASFISVVCCQRAPLLHLLSFKTSASLPVSGLNAFSWSAAWQKVGNLGSVVEKRALTAVAATCWRGCDLELARVLYWWGRWRRVKVLRAAGWFCLNMRRLALGGGSTLGMELNWVYGFGTRIQVWDNLHVLGGKTAS